MPTQGGKELVDAAIYREMAVAVLALLVVASLIYFMLSVK